MQRMLPELCHLSVHKYLILCVYSILMHMHKCKINCTNDSTNRSSFQALQTDQSKIHNNRKKKLFVFIVYTSIRIWIDFFCWYICWLIAMILNITLFRPFIGNERLLNCIGYSADRKLLTLSEPKSEYTCLFSSYRMVFWYLQLYYLCLVSLPILLREYSFQFSSVSWDTRDPVKVDTRLFIHLSISIISLFYTATRCLHNRVYYAQTH